MKTYKAFDADLKCKGYQFEVGKEYTHEGAVKICNSGFHSCENPFDCLSYYDLCESRFAQVTVAGETKTHDNDSKIASAKIFIECELRLPEFIKSCVNYLIDLCKDGVDSSQLAASGYSSNLAASGYYSNLAASGEYSKLAASGYYSKLSASGDYSKLAASGDSAIIMSAGIGSKAKIGKNGVIVLARWVEEEKRFRVSVGYEGEGIEEDIFYKLDNDGNFVKA